MRILERLTIMFVNEVLSDGLYIYKFVFKLSKVKCPPFEWMFGCIEPVPGFAFKQVDVRARFPYVPIEWDLN